MKIYIMLIIKGQKYSTYAQYSSKPTGQMKLPSVVLLLPFNYKFLNDPIKLWL